MHRAQDLWTQAYRGGAGAAAVSMGPSQSRLKPSCAGLNLSELFLGSANPAWGFPRTIKRQEERQTTSTRESLSNNVKPSTEP
jgi:hypothetical protein